MLYSLFTVVSHAKAAAAAKVTARVLMYTYIYHIIMFMYYKCTVLYSGSGYNHGGNGCERTV
jgi:hypothetical protein